MVEEAWKTTDRDGSPQRGSALMLALGTIIVTSMAVLLVAGMIQTRRISFDLQKRNIMLSALADAAMAQTMAGIDKDENFSGFQEHSLGSGSISSSVSWTNPKSRRVVATGRHQGWKAVIEARVRLEAAGPVILEWSFRQALDDS